jgi:valyl-tRNA synthetase
MYAELFKSAETPSIHMSSLPAPHKKFMDEGLEKEMEIAKEIVEAASNARQKAGLKLRWPVSTIVIQTEEEAVKKSVRMMGELLSRICNAKQVLLNEKPKGEFAEASFSKGKALISSTLDKELLKESLAKELIRQVQALRKQHGFSVGDTIALSMSSDAETNAMLKGLEALVVRKVNAKSYSVGALKGEFKGRLEFDEKKIGIAFSKLSR